jgi:ribulose-phosphate 3-epimerase
MNNFLKDKTISISILNVEDLDSFLNRLDEFRKKTDFQNIVIHLDIMDKNFVSGQGLDLELIKIIKKYNFFVDVHLMCNYPKNYIDKAILFGADNITVHYEIENLYENLKYLNEIKSNLKKENKQLSIGLSVKPGSDINKLINYVDMCDIILLMCVEPGLGGQTYINETNKKIEIAVDMKKMVQIDGGINDVTIVEPNKLGVNSFVIGSYITKDKNNMLKKIIEIENIINSERGN